MVNEKINNIINNGNSEPIRGLATRIKKVSEEGSLNDRVNNRRENMLDELKSAKSIVKRPTKDGGDEDKYKDIKMRDLK